MKYTILIGSHRKASQSSKVGKWIGRQLEQQGNTIDYIDLSGNPFPLWDESYWEDGSELRHALAPEMQKCAAADGLVIIAPEWGGMVPAALKNFLLFLGPKEVGHKPVLLVGVSASRGGAYPIAELRMSGYKNTKMVYIPDHLIVRNVKDVLNDDNLQTEDKGDVYIKERIRFSLHTLESYAQALQQVRTDENNWNEKYAYGM